MGQVLHGSAASRLWHANQPFQETGCLRRLVTLFGSSPGEVERQARPLWRPCSVILRKVGNQSLA
jgi:hypothetical protein